MPHNVFLHYIFYMNTNSTFIVLYQEGSSLLGYINKYKHIIYEYIKYF